MRGPMYRVAQFVLRIPALRVTSDHAYVITLRHIHGTTFIQIILHTLYQIEEHVPPICCSRTVEVYQK